ncbi:MAG: hypothetical protein HC772_16095 [Leptolyngbyaceae cyanobacterium CRU_2_3]|nr:hypothetical protein [Leptolyngbyaceae cyanobacterium CRU_2_3]
MSDSLPSLPQYRVSIWEGITVLAGAVLLIAVGAAGLGVKALNNAFDPERAEAIAHSMADYAIPGGSQGLFGTNVGGGRAAVIGSIASLQAAPPLPDMPPVTLPEVELLIARVPVQSGSNTGSDAPEKLGSEFLFSGFSFSNQTPDSFQVNTTRVEEKAFCGAIAPVKIEEGNLTLTDQALPVPAVRYEVQVTLDKENHVAIVSAAGKTARENAATVFESMKCKP